jgi:hypothetical protein
MAICTRAWPSDDAVNGGDDCSSRGERIVGNSSEQFAADLRETIDKRKSEADSYDHPIRSTRRRV